MRKITNRSFASSVAAITIALGAHGALAQNQAPNNLIDPYQQCNAFSGSRSIHIPPDHEKLRASIVLSEQIRSIPMITQATKDRAERAVSDAKLKTDDSRRAIRGVNVAQQDRREQLQTTSSLASYAQASIKEQLEQLKSQLDYVAMAAEEDIRASLHENHQMIRGRYRLTDHQIHQVCVRYWRMQGRN